MIHAHHQLLFDLSIPDDEATGLLGTFSERPLNVEEKGMRKIKTADSVNLAHLVEAKSLVTGFRDGNTITLKTGEGAGPTITQRAKTEAASNINTMLTAFQISE